MKTYKMKRTVVGILLVILTLGFCVVGTGAASAMGGPMGRQQGFMPNGQAGSMDGQDFDGQMPSDGGNFDRSSESFPGGDFGPNGQNGPMDQQSFDQNGGADSNGGFSRDGGFGPGNQRGFGGHGGPGRDGGHAGMDNDVLKAIDALEDGETKTNLKALMENVHSAMEALHDADDDSLEAAEAGVKDARDALNTALAAAGIDASVSEPPEKPEDGNDMTRPEYPEDGSQNRPENGGSQNGPDFLNREALESIDLEDEEQVQNLFQQFLTWLKGSNT